MSQRILSSPLERPRARIVGLDVARGLAVLLMLQTHAYDGWVLASERSSLAFAFTRLLGTLPLPMFLAIAGLNVGQRVARAAHSGGSREELQHGLLHQAARVIASGYGLNALYACLDGFSGIATFLRIDILHCIGLSTALLSTCLGRSRRVDPRAFARRCLILGGLTLLLCPPLSQFAHQHANSPFRLILAPWLEVPGVSSMPVVPLLFFATSFAALGAHFALPALFLAGPGTRFLGQAALLCLCLVLVGTLGDHWFRAQGILPSRTHPSIWLNALDLLGRAGWVLGLTLFVTRGRQRDVPLLSLLGRHSLLLYGLHLPFCYGRFSVPLKRATTLGAATLWLVGLVGLCWLVAFMREPRARSAARAVSLGS